MDDIFLSFILKLTKNNTNKCDFKTCARYVCFKGE